MHHHHDPTAVTPELPTSHDLYLIVSAFALLADVAAMKTILECWQHLQLMVPTFVTVVATCFPSIFLVASKESWNCGLSGLDVVYILLSGVGNMLVVNKVCKIETAIHNWYCHGVTCHYNKVCILFFPLGVVA